MLYSDSLREMMQNAINESFWDAHGVEIGACANLDPKNVFLGDRNFFCGLDALGSAASIASGGLD